MPEEYITRPEVTEQYIRIPVRKRLASDQIRTITISEAKGIKALYSVNRKVVLTYLFARSKGWTMAKAKAWVKAHSKSLKEEQEMIQKNQNSQFKRFEFQIPLLKARQVVELDEDGNEVIERYVEGVASTTDKDLHGDRMAPEAIDSMADSIKRHIILLNAEHDRSWQSELGEVTELTADEKYNLLLVAKLDKTSKANDLWYALTEKNKKLGLSVGGYVKEVELIQEEDEDGEKSWVRIYKDIELDHVAVVSSPANPRTWVSVIAKSLEDTEFDKKEETTMLEKVKWDRAFINRLPDAAFAYIESGGKKDESGRTVPRSLRHYPHHNASVKSGAENGSVDKPHLRNALARCGQKTAFWQQALPHLKRHAKALGIGKVFSLTLKDLDKELLLTIIDNSLGLFSDEQVIAILERSIMDKKVPLEAEDVKKQDEASSEPEPEEEAPEDSAAPETGEPESESEEETPEGEESKEEESDEGSEEKEEKEKEEEKEGESDEEESDEPEGEETEEDKPDEGESNEEESDEEKPEETNSEEEKGASEVTKALSSLLTKVDEVLKGQEALTKDVEKLVERVDKLEEQPAGRKIAIEKGIGEEGESDEKSEEAMEKEIADLKEKYPNDPNLFAKIQRVRQKYGV